MKELFCRAALAAFFGAALLQSHAAEYAGKTVTVYVTAKDTGQRLAKAAEIRFSPMAQPLETQPCIFVDPAKKFQSVVGIGGALTDAAAETLYKLPPASQTEILTAYFDPTAGIGYSLGRTHINSCDFSSESYMYVQEGDIDLKSFSIAHDRKYRLPLIKAALAKAGPDFALYVSPWSPPAWMKSNHELAHGGKLLPQFADAWAAYYVKFIRAYEQEGVPIWGLSVQNEPMASQTWESCMYTGEEERDFVKNHLGPTLKRAGLQDKKLIVWDHNRMLMYQRAKAVLDDPQAAQYVWGVGFHWYLGDCFENVKQVHEAYPAANLIFTEGCHGPFDFKRLNEWQWGEGYGRALIHDFNNGAVAWTDWNILLDEKGGPNHVGNFCFAPVHADTSTGKLYYMNSFYYLGHFSKFVRPGARRIASSSMLESLLNTAFVNRDGKIVVVVMNESEKTQPFYLWLDGNAAKTESPARSIMTLVL